MKISYNWLKDYLPGDEVFSSYVNNIDKISEILTSVGLEVEAIEEYESIPGSLEGLIVGEVMTCEKHPDADKLKVTSVFTGSETLQVVCGAPNVAAGQKVILATPGTRLYPIQGEPFTIKKSKIRGVESNGMICAEDEIGIGHSHEGIIVLPSDRTPGEPASNVYPVYKDYLIEIGLTPNRMDAQSHLGVAKDICAWLAHHTGREVSFISPLGSEFKVDNTSLDIRVEVKDTQLIPRYSGVTISGIQIAPSPDWMQNRLKTIGLKPINNVVDITNFILHTTGQPLHAFDAEKIKDNKVIVETLAAGTPFITLDGKERKLSNEDIMICSGDDTPMCIGGVFGGIESGVSDSTKNIFLESAVFNPVSIRKTLIRHDLRTDAASRFEKGVDITKTVDVLKYAANLIKELCGGAISSEIQDIYKEPTPRTVKLSYAYLKKLSGREFKSEEVENILKHLGFKTLKKDDLSITVRAPESNPDITLPADIVEEILRISGLDNVPIPRQIKMTPGFNNHAESAGFRNKVSAWLTGNGFAEIFTNSITNDKYYADNKDTVHILNSLSEELTILRKTMLPTGLEAVEYNLNRQNKDLLLFEFGKTYSVNEGGYHESDRLAIYCTGHFRKKSWNTDEEACDIYLVKGIASALFALAGIEVDEKSDGSSVSYIHHEKAIARAEEVSRAQLQAFSIKQPVYYLDIDWNLLLRAALKTKTVYRPVSKFPIVTRDLSMVLDRGLHYQEIREAIASLRMKKLSGMQMFDLYESDKLGKEKKSIALSFSFSDSQKTMTDKETDKLMRQITGLLEERFNAEIRSHA